MQLRLHSASPLPPIQCYGCWTDPTQGRLLASLSKHSSTMPVWMWKAQRKPWTWCWWRLSRPVTDATAITRHEEVAAKHQPLPGWVIMFLAAGITASYFCICNYHHLCNKIYYQLYHNICKYTFINCCIYFTLDICSLCIYLLLSHVQL